jgi:hypothetical protein
MFKNNGMDFFGFQNQVAMPGSRLKNTNGQMRFTAKGSNLSRVITKNNMQQQKWVALLVKKAWKKGNKLHWVNERFINIQPREDKGCLTMRRICISRRKEN